MPSDLRISRSNDRIGVMHPDSDWGRNDYVEKEVTEVFLTTIKKEDYSVDHVYPISETKLPLKTYAQFPHQEKPPFSKHSFPKYLTKIKIDSSLNNYLGLPKSDSDVFLQSIFNEVLINPPEPENSTSYKPTGLDSIKLLSKSYILKKENFLNR